MDIKKFELGHGPECLPRVAQLGDSGGLSVPLLIKAF